MSARGARAADIAVPIGRRRSAANRTVLGEPFASLRHRRGMATHLGCDVAVRSALSRPRHVVSSRGTCLRRLRSPHPPFEGFALNITELVSRVVSCSRFCLGCAIMGSSR